MFDPDYDDWWRHYTLHNSRITKLGKRLKIEATSSYRTSGGISEYTLHEGTIGLEVEYDETQKSKTNMLGKIISLDFKGVHTKYRSGKGDTWIEEGKENLEFHFDNLEVTSRYYWSTKYVVDFKGGVKPSFWSYQDAKDTYLYRDNDNNGFYVQIEFK